MSRNYEGMGGHCEKKGFSSYCLIYVDSYYLTQESREYYKNEGIPNTASIASNRFKTVCDVLRPMLDRSGDFVTAYNTNSNEALVYHWDADFKVKKNCDGLFIRKKSRGVIGLLNSVV